MVAEESGGINIPIKVTLDPSTFAQLEKSLRIITGQIAEFADAAKKLNTVRRKGASQSKKSATALKKEAEAAKELGVSVERLRAATKVRGDLQRKLNKEELVAARAAANKFQQERRRTDELVAQRAGILSVTEAIKKQKIATAKLTEADRRQNELTGIGIRALGLQKTEIGRLILAKEKLIELQSLTGDKELRDIKATTEAVRLKNLVLQQQANALALIMSGQAAAFPGIGNNAPGGRGGGGAGGRKSPKGRNDDFNKSLEKTESLGNRISFTFRRLFGILAAFTIARKLVEGFTSAIRTAIQFNAKLEEAELGLASLFLAAGRVTDAMGDTVTGARGLALATGVARDQIKLLRIDALQTAATFEELLTAFQTAVAPGIQAGLGIDQIREFAVSISKAATALGVPQQQLAEEIRSVLQGTIRIRDTRIAVALGITNADIRRAKELGILADFLEERFSAFAEAGVVAQQNFNVLFTNTRDALIQLSSSVGEGFFLELKGLLSDVKDEIIDLNKETGKLEFQPAAVETAEAFFSILKGAAEEVRLLQQNLTGGDFVAIGETLGQAFSAVFAGLRVAVEILVEGLGKATKFLGAIFNQISKVSEIFAGLGIGPLVREIIVWSVTFKVILISVKGIAASIKAILFFLPGISIAAKALAKAFVSIGKSVSFMAALTGLTTTLKASAIAAGTLAIKSASVAGAFLAAVVYAKSLFDILSKTNTFTDEMAKVLKIEKTLDTLRKQESEMIKLRVDGAVEWFDRLDAIKKKEEELAEAKKEAIEAGIDPDVRDESLTEAIKRNLSSVGEGISGVFDTLFEKLFASSENTEVVSKSIEEIFAGLPAVIGQGTQALSKQQAVLEQLKDAAIESQFAYEASVQSLGASSEVATQRLEIAKAESDLEIRNRELRSQAQAAENGIQNALTQQAKLKTIIAGFNSDEVIAKEGILNITKQEALLLKEQQDLQSQIALDRVAANEAEKAGLEDKEKTLRDRVDKGVARLAEIDIQIKASIRGLQTLLADVFGEDTEALERALTITRELSNAIAAQAGNEEQLLAIKQAERDIEKELFKVTNDRNRLVAIESIRNHNDAIRSLQIELDLQRQLTQAQSIFSGDPRQAELDQSRAKTKQEAETLELLKRQKLESLLTSTANILLTRDAATKAALMAQQVSEQKRFNIELDIQNEKLEQAKLIQQELLEQYNRPILSGIRAAFNTFKNSALDTFTQTVEIMTAVFDGFVNWAADSITSIFDPRNTQTAKQRLGQFLLQIANMIIAMLIRIAVVKAALGLNGLFGEGGSEFIQQAATTSNGPQFAPGVKKGGLIGRGGVPGLAHLQNPQGLATGGEVGKHLSGPKGVDTAAIWAQPGEYMMRLAAVRKYGSDVMSAINHGLVDPLALRALSGSRRLSRHMQASKRPHFAAGGLIGDQPASLVSGGEDAAPAPTVGFLLASEEQMDTMLAGGKGSFFRFFGDNAATFRGLLQ